MRTEAQMTASWKRLSPPLVSVICPTFNHERYIRQAIESILAQETDFPFEIVIHDDASTDSTSSIVKQLANEYPTIVRVILQTENQYSRGVKITPLVVPHTRGKYIAFCEGDDYWTNPDKLQRQVGILEANPQLIICGHLCANVDQNGEPLAVSSFTGARCPSHFTIADAATGTPIHPSSWVYRRFDWAGNQRSELLNSLPAADDPMMLILLTMGDGHCLRECWSAYRLHPGGSWSNKTEQRKRFDMLRFHIAAYRLIPSRLIFRQSIAVSRSVIQLFRELLKACLRARSVKPLLEFFHQFRIQQTLTHPQFLAAAIMALVLFPALVVAKIWKEVAAMLKRSPSKECADV
ncbi:MAG: glycosyltransferase family 2 protein [Proteobacteria bacterium]|nr:glycosyltransferase family 2 protein [Pseudomonadota bacterium]